MSLLQLRDVLLERDDSSIYLSSRGTEALAVSIVFTILATAFVGARLYTRVRLMGRMESNDWMIVIALINSFIFMGLDVVEASSGMGMHLKDLPPYILERQMKAFWLTIPFYNSAVLCAKASILMQYFRVFPTTRMRVVCWVMIGMLGIYGTWAVVSAFLNCIPVAKFWDDAIEGYCLSKPGLWFSNASMHIATDLTILIIPIPALLTVDLPKKQKCALIVMFALGGFVCVTSVARLVSLKKISDSIDPTYDNVGAASWSAIECNTGIICACLPTLKPLLARVMPGMLSTLSGDRYGSRGVSTRRASVTWNGDGSTLGAPGEDPEYGPGDPDRALTLMPSKSFKRRENSTSNEKNRLAKVSSVPEQRHRVSASSSPLRK